ncbi:MULTISPECIES: hypothetical protein [unclassified Rhizobium]|nr:MULTISPECIES: hypothetical protein [unclassified Rhizobium]MBB3285987.1 hypothetical protein [Rhizobium sp. BK252]MBB3400851.1 hypothetical protein [Rhizobium sp. BK289]MBB3413305.1 hypothetical protein [Rhizobium sp. BK284]MBB3481317.1 hypothetical protein [Rhizobium sp. BK347]
MSQDVARTTEEDPWYAASMEKRILVIYRAWKTDPAQAEEW